MPLVSIWDKCAMYEVIKVGPQLKFSETHSFLSHECHIMGGSTVEQFIYRNQQLAI